MSKWFKQSNTDSDEDQNYINSTNIYNLYSDEDIEFKKKTTTNLDLHPCYKQINNLNEKVEELKTEIKELRKEIKKLRK